MPPPQLTALAAAVLLVEGRPERVLEIGCGDGDRTLFLAREYPAARVRGVDRSADAIRSATARIGLDPEGRVAFKHGGSRALPYPDGFFDLVVQVGGAMRPAETARVARDGGQLVLVGEWRLLEWRLGKWGFVADTHGEAAGERFHVYRLETGEPPPE